MKREQFANVWDALEDDPVLAANLSMRSEVLIALQQRVTAWKVGQAQAARRLGITQSGLTDLLRGRIDKFSLDALVDLALRARVRVRLRTARPA